MCWPPMCCLSGRAHGGPWDLLGNSLEQEIQPTSPDGWCAMRDDGQGFFHITKAHKHRLVTLIMRKGLPLGENPLVLSNHCRGLMYNSPKGITLNASAIDLTVSETVWQWVTGLALFFSQPTGWTLYVLVTGAPASTLSPILFGV